MPGHFVSPGFIQNSFSPSNPRNWFFPHLYTKELQNWSQQKEAQVVTFYCTHRENTRCDFFICLPHSLGLSEIHHHNQVWIPECQVGKQNGFPCWPSPALCVPGITSRALRSTRSGSHCVLNHSFSEKRVASAQKWDWSALEHKLRSWEALWKTMKMVEGPQNPPSSLLFPMGDLNVLLDLGSLLLSFKKPVPSEAVPKIQVPYRMAVPLQGGF